MEENQILISVIFPTLNRASLLDKALSAVSCQSFSKEKFEVIVIDNGSTDKTKMISDKWRKVFCNFKYIYDSRPGLHTGRNRGCIEAKGEILVYGDDDIVPTETWLEGMYQAFQENDVAIVGGNIFPMYESRPPKWVKNLWIHENGSRILLAYSCIILGKEKRYIPPNFVFGGNCGVKKDIIVKASGFHPDGVPNQLLEYRGDGESWISEYVKMNKLKALFVPEASVYHLVSTDRMNYDYISRVEFRSGISMQYTFLRNNKSKVLILRELLTLVLKICSWKFHENSLKNRLKIKRYQGRLFLLCRYISRKYIREWIHRSTYFDEPGIKQKERITKRWIIKKLKK